MKVDLHNVLIQPLLTEKVTALRESSNTIGFLVHPEVNRLQIKQAVETLLKVKVERVNVLNVQGKIKPHIHATYPLERAADALNEVMYKRVSGKVVLVTNA